MRNILITGASGFIGRNLLQAFKHQADLNVQLYDCRGSTGNGDEQLRGADIVFHLAGVNRPKVESEFKAVNAETTSILAQKLLEFQNPAKVVFASSTQANLDNAYGRSKLEAEEALRAYASQAGGEVVIYRLTNVFGKWCRPNHNSVVATFCYNLARDLPIQIVDANRTIRLIYIDDVVAGFLQEIDAHPIGQSPQPTATCCFKEVQPVYSVSLGDLAEQLRGCAVSRRTLVIPDLASEFTRKLYGTFLSYLPERDFAYRLTSRSDSRGVLAEFIKGNSFGQIFVSRTKPGITRGRHFHCTKAEKFLVLEGEGLIRLRLLGGEAVIEYPVSGTDWRVVDIPPGYTHSIENLGQSDMIVLFWASEIFEPARPDTQFEEVVL